MRGDHAAVEAALGELANAVAVRLAAEGWLRRELGGPSIAVFMLPMSNGVMAVVELARFSFRYPERFPVRISLPSGVGYEAALNLMPVLALPARPIIISDPQGHRRQVDLQRPEVVPSAAGEIVRLIAEHVVAFARQFPDPAAIEARLIAASNEDASDDEQQQEVDDADARDLLIMAAAQGKLDQARDLLARYATRADAASMDRDDRRFIRQLTRWLDAGGPPAPPVEQTLAILPNEPKREPRPSWFATKAASQSRREALDAVRTNAKGKSLDELVTMLAEEYASRGLDTKCRRTT